MWRAMHSNEGLHTSARHRARTPPLAGSSHVRRCGASEVWRGTATEPFTQDRIAARQNYRDAMFTLPALIVSLVLVEVTREHF